LEDRKLGIKFPAQSRDPSFSDVPRQVLGTSERHYASYNIGTIVLDTESKATGLWI